MVSPGRSLLKQSDADLGNPSDLTISELVLAYWTRHVISYYVKDGRATTQQERIKVALRHLREVYGHILVKDFGSLALKAVRQKYINHGYVRRYGNQLIGCLNQCFKWGVAESASNARATSWTWCATRVSLCSQASMSYPNAPI